MLEPESSDRFLEALDREGLQLALVAHRPPVTDPVLAMQETLSPLGDSVAQAWELLERAAWWAGEEERLSAVRFAEDTLLRPARLVPLVRLHAWLVVRSDLEGVSTGPWGVLRLDRARWAP